MSVPRQFAAGVKLPDGRVLIAGGGDSNADFSSTDIYDPANNSFSPGPSMSNIRQGATATLLFNGKALIAGGLGVIGGFGAVLNSSDIFDPKTNSFAPDPSMNVARWFATAVSLYDGKVLIVGGAGDHAFLSSSELYDPASNSFAVGPSMSTGREDLAATLLPNGGVLVVGGFDGHNEGGVTNTDLFSQ